MADKVRFFEAVFLDYIELWIGAALACVLGVALTCVLNGLEACHAAGYNGYSNGYCTHPAKDPVLLSEVEL